MFYKILITALIGGFSIFLLTLPRRDISKRMDGLRLLKFDEKTRDLAVWELVRWFLLLVMIAGIIVVWVAPVVKRQ